MPGVGTALEARCAVAAGFEAVYLSGYATSAWRHGQPDVGIINSTDVRDSLSAITEAIDIPVVCDADTGYGDVTNVAHTVRRLERLGAAGIQLEDQTWPKRCGHLTGKTVIPAEDHARKIAAAVGARRSPDTLVIARTDAIGPNGFDDAIERIKRYEDAGADVLFVDAPRSVEQLKAIGQTFPGRHLMANMSESGLTPHMSAEELYELGFSVVIFPSTALRIAARTFLDFFTELRATGDSRGWLDRMASLDELNELVGIHELEAAEATIMEAFAQ